MSSVIVNTSVPKVIVNSGMSTGVSAMQAAEGAATEALNSAAASAASAASAAIIADIASVQFFTNPLAKAIRVALLASASVRGPQVLDDADIDMGTNNFSVVVQKRITTTRPATNEILYHKHDGTTGVTVTLLTTGIVRLTLNGFNYDSTVALPSATNVEPVIMVPTVRETATTAGSVTFVVDGVQLGTALAISTRVEKIVNGGFDSDIANWTQSSGSIGTIAWNSGKLRIERTGGASRAYQAISLAAGETVAFFASATFVSGAGATATFGLRDGPSTTSTAVAQSATLVGVSGTLKFSYTSTIAETLYLHAAVITANGIFDFDTITSIDAHSVDNAANLYVLGTSSTTTEGGYYDAGIYNRALTVAECLAFCMRGPEFADIGATQTPAWASDFSAGENGVTGTNVTVTGNIDGIAGQDDWLRAVVATTGTNRRLNKTLALAAGKRYRVTLTIYIDPASVTTDSFGIRNQADNNVFGAIAALENIAKGVLTTVTFEAVAAAATSLRFSLGATGQGGGSATAGDTVYFKFRFDAIGVTGHWPAFNAQTNTGQLADRSGNKNHMLLPASGATIIGDRRPDVQLTWENTWAATSELQYFPGVNQACYPTNFYIEGIIITPSATTTAGFTIGNGSNAAYYATVSGPLTAGVPYFVPLTNRYPDGTNLKLTITPMANTTCTLSTTVFGRLLGGF